MKKKLALLLAMILVVSMLGACGGAQGGGSAAPASSEAQAGEEVKLLIWHYADDGTEEAYQEMADAFHADNPNITIEYDVLPYDSGPEKVTIAYATNTPPDILIDGYSRIAPAVKAGLTVDIQDVIDANKDAFVAMQIDGKMDNGHFGYLQTSLSAAYGVLVNLDIAERCGVLDMLPADNLTWSWDTYLEMLRKVKEADPTVIPCDLFAGSRSSDAWYYSWFLGNGVPIANDDHSATGFNIGENRDKAIEVLELFKTFVDEGLVQEGCATMTDEQADTFFQSGQMMILHAGWNNTMNTYTNQQAGTCVPFKYGMYALPSKDGKEPPTTATWGSSGMAGFKANGHEEAIKTFFDWYLKHQQYPEKIANIMGSMSSLKEVKYSWPNDDIAKLMAIGTKYTAEKAISSFGILEPWWTEFRETFYPQMQDFYTGNIDAGQVLDNWQKAADEVIKKNTAG